MKRKKRILAPVDFSAHSMEALRRAAKLARMLGRELLVLHVIHDPAEAPGYYRPKKKNKKALHKIRDLAEERFQEFINEFYATYPRYKSTPLETRLVQGLVVSRILEVVEEEKPFMVIMGSAGRTGLANLMLGSKAEQIVRLCPEPVTIVKLPKEKPAKKNEPADADPKE